MSEVKLTKKQESIFKVFVEENLDHFRDGAWPLNFNMLNEQLVRDLLGFNPGFILLKKLNEADPSLKIGLEFKRDIEYTCVIKKFDKKTSKDSLGGANGCKISFAKDDKRVAKLASTMIREKINRVKSKRRKKAST